jgi:N-dimethylarginine dimethylaminohydrolase
MNKNDGPYLEGGDTFVNGYEIYVGISGLASDLKGAKWLQGYLGSSYKVMPIQLRADVLHLDCCMALLKPGLGLICRGKILDPLPGQLKDFEFIEVTEEEAQYLGTNVLVLDENRLIVDSKFERIAEIVRRKGQEVILTPYQAPALLGGGFRCSHHPIRRDSKLS